MNTILVIVIGLVVGSFLNVCIYRIPNGMSIVKPRSKCTNCDHQIKSWENIPVLSYLLLGGKCSNCKTKISIRYPLIELLTAAVYWLIFYRLGLTIDSLLLMILFSVVIVLTFIDIDFQILPNKLLIIAAIPILIYILLNNLDRIVYHFAGAIVLLLVFLLIGYIGKLVYKVDSMGMGDVKYAAIIGLLLGLKLGILAFILSFFTAAIMVVVLTILKKVDRKQRLAFGPFLSIGLFIAFFWGQNIINWYLGFYN